VIFLGTLRSEEPSFVDLLNYAAIVRDGVVLCKDGSLVGGFLYRGPDVASAVAEERNALSCRINAILSRLGTGYTLHVDAFRQRSREYPAASDSYFPDRVSQRIDEERRVAFEKEGNHFESSYALFITFHPPRNDERRFARALFKGGSLEKASDNEIIERFNDTLREIERELSRVLSVSRLRIETRSNDCPPLVVDNLVSLINSCITGKNHPVLLPPCGMYLDSLLAGDDFCAGVMPRLGNNYIGVVSIAGLPPWSSPQMLSVLDSIPGEYRWNTRFIFLDPQDAIGEMKKYRRKWQQRVRGFSDQVFQTSRGVLDRDALSMVEESEHAIALAVSRAVTYGFYTSTIIMRHHDSRILQDSLEGVVAIINGAGFQGRCETLNTVEAFFGSLPGHTVENVRRPLISSQNLADLLPLTSLWAGRQECPCPFFPPGSPPLMVTKSEGSTPFRLNLHVGDVGHTLIFGPTGSGKSTLLSMVVAQFFRYENAQVFCFEKGGSMLPLVRALMGNHFDLCREQRVEMCPLSFAADTDGSFLKALQWLETIITLQNVTLTPTQRTRLTEALQRLVRSRSYSLHDLRMELQDVELREALSFYVGDGPAASLLDGEKNTIEFGNFQVFELESLMALGEGVVLPVLLYLFDAIERQLTGAPSLIVVDEAWLVLGHAAFRDKLREWFKVLRKANCAVVLATQSLSDASRSGIFDVLLESCPTKILLPNPVAKTPVASDFYRSIGLNDRELSIISEEAQPKRHYYVISPEGKRLFELDLGPLALSLCGASGKNDLNRIQELFRNKGNEWIENWLSERGVAA
jgi:type IV secretion system protein VirB4